MDEYEKLMRCYKQLRRPTSTAAVLHQFPAVKEELDLGPSVKPSVKPLPLLAEEETDVDRLLRPFVEKMEAGRDAGIQYLANQGIRIDKKYVTAVGDAMEDYMRTSLSEDTLTGFNATPPSQFLETNMRLLQQVLDKFVQGIDTYMNYNLNLGQNMEEDITAQDLQMQELLVQAIMPSLAEQAGVAVTEQPLASSVRVLRSRRRQQAEERPTPAISKRPLEAESARRRMQRITRSSLTNLTIPLLRVGLWGFRTTSFVVQGLTQFMWALASSPAYFQVVVNSTPRKKSSNLRVQRAAARRTLTALNLSENSDIFDLRTQQMIQSNSFWQYAVRRVRDFVSAEAAKQLLPGLIAMIIQSGTGFLIAYVSDPNMALRATQRIKEGEQEQLRAVERMETAREKLEALRSMEGPEGQKQLREALFKTFVDEHRQQLTAANFHSSLEKLRFMEDRSEAATDLLLHFDAWKVLLNEMQKRAIEVAFPFFTADDRALLINSDEVLSLRNRAFYEENKNTLNALAAAYSGELEPVRRVTADLPCVRSDSVCENVDEAVGLSGAADFLETNVKILQRQLSVQEVRTAIASQPELDLWKESRQLATDVLLDVPKEPLEQIAALQALGISKATNAVFSGNEELINTAKREFPEQFQAAKTKFIADSISKAIKEYTEDVSKPISTESLQREAFELNKDAAWEALFQMLAVGSNNTIVNNLLLSVMASISKALLKVNLSSVVSFTQSFATNILPNTLQWIPRMSSIAIQYGMVNSMLRLAVANGIIGATNILDEWDGFLDEQTERMPRHWSDAFTKLFINFMKALRWLSRGSLAISGYINRNAMVGWIVFGALIGFHGLSIALWEVGINSLSVAAAKTAIQSSGIIVLAGAEGVLHSLLQRYMSRYIEERRAVVEAARDDPSAENLVAADAAQTQLYYSPVRWALWGSAIRVAITTAAALLRHNTELWNNLFQIDFPQQLFQTGATVGELSPALLQALKDMETSLTGTADYSSRYTYLTSVSEAVLAAAGRPQ